MAKEKSDAGKKEKKEKKEKRAQRDGISKSKKEKVRTVHADDAPASVNGSALAPPAVDAEEDTTITEGAEIAPANGLAPPPRLVGAMVPFANPLADDKACKKVLKSVRKGTSNCHRSLPRHQASGSHYH